jgi:hypothetical protein
MTILKYYISKICDEVVNLTTDILNGGTQKANMLLNSSDKILTQEKVFFSSEKSIILNPGFRTNSNGVFNAKILGCTDLN